MARKGTLWMVAAGLAVTAVVALDVTATSAPDAAPAVPLSDVPNEVLPAIAQANELTVDAVRDLADGAHFEVDADRRLRSVEPVPSQRAAAASGPEAPADVFTLHSRQGSNRTLYLDFTGHTVEGTAWNNGARIEAPPYDADGDDTSFGETERATIYQAFLSVAEDFSVFDVDVTTEEPSEDRITRSGSGDQVFGTRATITPRDVTGCGCGGQAYIGVFDDPNRHATYQPAWAYAGNWYSGKDIAEIVSHEVGHNLGLLHDGRTGEEYYGGHENWAPIMGTGYYQPVTQWSRGEYADASRTEDDLAVIPANGAAALSDDHADTPEGATPLAGNDTVAAIVATDRDVDVFAFDHTGGTLTVAALPAAFVPNLDIRLGIVTAAGVEVAVVDPPVGRVSAVEASGLDARFEGDLPAGRYLLRVEGTGFGDPSVNGFTGYASVGTYTVTAHSG